MRLDPELLHESIGEWEHRLYAVRDLDAVEARCS
jgi:hypothetical protein